MNDKELKENFIKYFGEEKWDQEEMLGKLIPLQKELSDYLNINMLPVVCEEELLEDSRLYIKDEYIALSPKMLENYTDAAKSLIHEMRHQYQIICCCDPNTKENPELVKKWDIDLKSLNEPVNPYDQDSVDKYYSLIIELDAHAFSKWYMLDKLGIETHHPLLEYDAIIDFYIERYFK